MNDTELLASIKLRLGLSTSKVDVNPLLLDIIKDTKTQLTIMTNKNAYDTNLDFVTKEVTIIRYNRLGSEGMEQESVDGHTMKFLKSDFAPYADFIAHFTDNSGEEPGDGWQRGAVEFI